jgi:hypothetical protein
MASPPARCGEDCAGDRRGADHGQDRSVHEMPRPGGALVAVAPPDGRCYKTSVHINNYLRFVTCLPSLAQSSRHLARKGVLRTRDFRQPGSTGGIDPACRAGRPTARARTLACTTPSN